MKKYELTRSQKLEQALRTFYHYTGLLPSPARYGLGYRTLKGDIEKLIKWIKR